ncbi:DUF6049 family protein [Actinomadura alba]|uniref:Secreted protein n=1 Tax=Actinomadura alba TaxID=406431 RepID=A0ABR7LN57_9ACTN|nr:DUF6049 family protein [Actinomadura alba]MBC6466170.1 hypothetical protein [Actinomadura alba]
MRVLQAGTRGVVALVVVLLSAAPAGSASAAQRAPASAVPLQAAARQPATAEAVHDPASRQSRSRAGVSLVLQSIPKTVRPGSKIGISGYVQNHTGQQLTGVSVRLRWRSRPVNGRTELAQFASGSAPALVSATTAVPLSGPLAPGRQVKWKLETTSRDLSMNDFGVYPISIEVLNAATQTVVAQPTFLTFMPADQGRRPKPTEIAWVWPMIDRPHRTTGTTFLDDALEKDLAPTGRLGGLAQVAAQAGKSARVPLTWAVDPALLDDAREMSNGYTLKGVKDRKATKKPKSNVAGGWLANMKSMTDPYFTTPYADPDTVALVRQGMSGHLKSAYANAAVANDILGRSPATPVGWPVNGVARQQTLDAMAGNGTGTFLMSSEVLLSTAPQGYAADAITTLQTARGTKPTLVYDATLSDIVSGDTQSPGAAVLAEQRFLAETAMITAEMPNRPRTLIIAPQRRWNPKPKFAENLLSYTAKAQWLKEVPLSAIQKDTPIRRTFTGYPVGYDHNELGGTYLKNVREIATRANRFSGIFDQTPASNTYEQSVLRMESTYWRGRERRARAFRQTVGAAIDETIDKVHLVPNKRIGLSGNSGFIPITVANDLREGTVNVVLRVTSENPGRLEIGGGTAAGTAREWQLKLSPRQKETVKIPVEANANGYTNLSLELLAPQSKRKFGKDDDAAVSTVHTTGYGRMALRITGGALAVLFIGVAVRVLRAKRRNGAEESDGAEPGGHAGG